MRQSLHISGGVEEKIILKREQQYLAMRGSRCNAYLMKGLEKVKQAVK